MKRYKDLYEKIISMDNLELAERKARIGKERSRGVIWFDKNRDFNLNRLHEILKNETYRTSIYRHTTIMEKKERNLSILPYYPDRIVHHAIMNIMEPIFIKRFTSNTFQCIKNRGIRACQIAVEKALKKDFEHTQYCLQIDIVKFYPSISHKILKEKLSRLIKDKKLIKLLFEIVDSDGGDYGIPIGNYISQFFANFYLCDFDHWVKEKLRVKYYYRYADDVVILGKTKQELHEILYQIRKYLNIIELQIKHNYQIYPVDKRGIDFVGYVFRHNYIKLRKGIKQNLVRKIKKLNKKGKTISEKEYRIAISPWWGWCKYSNSRHLINTLSKTSTYKIEF